jgi:DNA-binding NarL/FixJ family response regulator
VPRLEAAVWAKIAAHLAVGLRIRRRAARFPSEPPRSVNPASEDAARAWQGLVEGGFSLVDQFDHDGKRYVVARRNERWGRVATLTQREEHIVALAAAGHSNKRIALELGVCTSTVALHLGNAAAKFGVEGRVAIIRAYVAHRAAEEIR